MKYILLIPVALFFMSLVIISMIMGCIRFCWDFRVRSWYKGVQWLDKKTNFYYYGAKFLNQPA